MHEPQTLVEHQVLLEQLFNKNQTITRIRTEFEECKEIDFAEIMGKNSIPKKFGFDVLIQMALHKRANLEVMIGLMWHHFGDAQMTANMLKHAAECDLMDWDHVFETFVVRYDISRDVQEDLDRFQYPLPMVIEPKEVRTNKESGYMLTDGSVILKKNFHNDDVCLDHINRANKVRLTINQNTATLIKNKWRNLDKTREGESREEFLKRKKAFEKHDRVAKDVMSILTARTDVFYLTHKYDKRGRVYCQGHHVTYQGTPWNKAVIEFADKEVTPV